MTDATSAVAGSGENRDDASGEPKRRELLQLPGLAAIGLYLAALAGVLRVLGGVAVGVVAVLLVLFQSVLLREQQRVVAERRLNAEWTVNLSCGQAIVLLPDAVQE